MLFAPLDSSGRKAVPMMKKTLAAAAALLTISASAFAALPPGVFTSQRPAGPPPHHSHVTSSQRVHVGPSQFTHTPTGNRVRMTNPHGHTGPVGGRMSSGSFRHGGSSSATVHVGPPAGPARHHIGPVSGPRYDRNYVRPITGPYHPCHRPAGATQGITADTTGAHTTGPYGSGTP